jgi:hypothetical protein
LQERNITKRIVCLANSRKHSGRCIAGKEVLAGGYGGWIRPISTRDSGEVSEEERRYRDGSSAQVFDIIDIPMLAAAPDGHQVENFLIDARQYWTKMGGMGWADLKPLLDSPESLWLNGDSSYHGRNDRVRAESTGECTYSLCLIHPDHLTVHVTPEGDEISLRRKVRAAFRYRAVDYKFSVTDPAAE